MTPACSEKDNSLRKFGDPRITFQSPGFETAQFDNFLQLSEAPELEVLMRHGRGWFGGRLPAVAHHGQMEEIPLLPCHFSSTYIKLWQSRASSRGTVKAGQDNGSEGKDFL